MLENPDNLRHRSIMDGDPLTDILTLVNARCVMAGGLVAGGAWALRFPPPEKIKFAAVVKGACWLAVDGEEAPLRLETGDVFLLTAERSFVLAGDLAAEQTNAAGVFSDTIDGVARLGGGDDFFAVGGHIALDASRGALLADVLPPLLHVRSNSPEASAMQWLLDHIVREVSADRPGAILASEQLSQLLLVQILRVHLAASGLLTAGWLRALRDERIAPALRLMHSNPSRTWQLGELAKQSAMSRTSFALRFKDVAGVAPLTYLMNWRMRLAEHALRDGKIPVSAIAHSLGYTSESAFSNAFKRVTGTAPKRYRSTVCGLDDAAKKKNSAPLSRMPEGLFKRS